MSKIAITVLREGEGLLAFLDGLSKSDQALILKASKEAVNWANEKIKKGETRRPHPFFMLTVLLSASFALSGEAEQTK